jgi:hypothetical protein
MNPWSNIETSPDDPEIIEINKFETALGRIPENVLQIRKLISGFEVCHFKYLQHITYIKDSIANLKPNIILEDIGKTHFRYGAEVLEKDKSGRSLSGQIYVSALTDWLDDIELGDDPKKDEGILLKITKWLGQRDPEKERLVRLLIARLKWDWESYEKLLKDNAEKKLENQVCRIDICHYNFPRTIDSIIMAIGQLRPVDFFEGCGSYSSKIKSAINDEFILLNDTIKSIISKKELDHKLMMKMWLMFCLAKTFKEQVGLKQSLVPLLDKL